MISILPEAYPDEIIFSYFKRYHTLSGNRNWLFTSNELFGKSETIPNLYYPTHLNHFCSQVPKELNLTPDNIIKDMSMFPFFKPFMSDERAQKIVEKMRSGDTRRLIGEIGFNTGNIFVHKEKVVKVCPKCFHEDKNKYGETYIHRNHQIPGNLFVIYMKCL